MRIKTAAENVFSQLIDSVNRLSSEQYAQPCLQLTNNSVGQHVRHIIELFQCLDAGYWKGIVNYESRRRDREIENDKDLAISLLKNILQGLDKPDKKLCLQAFFDEEDQEPLLISTNYYRELAYNLEHTIHHMALIRVGISEISDMELSDQFGVASSTLKYRRQCAP